MKYVHSTAAAVILFFPCDWEVLSLLYMVHSFQGARMVRELFEMARTKKACIVFFDEIDAIGGKCCGPLMRPNVVDNVVSEMFHHDFRNRVLNEVERS